MKLQIGQKNIDFLGDNVKDRLGTIDFVEKTPTVFSAVLDKNYTNSEISKIFNPSELELGEIYNLLGTLSTDTKALFSARDKDGFSRFLFAWCEPNKDNGGWRIATPNEQENPYWQKGILLISKTKI